MEATIYIANLISSLIPTVEKSLDKIAQVAVDHVKSTTLFKGSPDSGIRANTIIIKDGQLSRTVLANKFYAFYLEEGNNQKGPYIYPVKAKALHFKVNGEDVFCKRAKTHEGYHFMEAAFKHTMSVANNIINEDLGRIIKGA